MPTNTAPTLRARRSVKTGVIKPVDKRRLISNSEDNNITEEQQSNSLFKSILWFFVVITLAIISYFALRTYLTEKVNVEDEVIPLPTTVEDNSLIASNTLPDEPIAPFEDTTVWHTGTHQIQSTSGLIEYQIESIVIQPHTSYVSLLYEVSGGSLSDFPQTTAEMLSDINLSIEHISTNSSHLNVNQKIEVNSQIISNLSRISFEDSVDSYLIGLKEEQPFALYTRLIAGKKFIVLDILLPERNKEDIVVKPTKEGTTPSISPTTRPLVSGEENLTNEFSENIQKVVTSTNGNIAKILKYNYFDSSDKFTYKLLLEDVIPNASASLNGEILTLEVNNLSFDGIVGNGGSGSTDLKATGVSNVLKVEISNSNNTSRYEFTLNGKREFKLYADEEDKALILEVKN